jgi:hypothetical protein
MKLGGERLGGQESVSKCLQAKMSDQPSQRGVGAFYSPPPPEGNLAVGVSETHICPGRGPNMSNQPLWTQPGDQICPVGGLSC